MTSYLIKSGTLPFTGAEICAELGIDESFAPDLDTMLAVECCNSAAPVTRSVWWVSDGPRFEQESLHGKCHPNTVSGPFYYQGARFMECTYEPRDWAVAIVRKHVIARARASEDVNLWRAVREADERKRAASHDKLRSQLQASLAEVA